MGCPNGHPLLFTWPIMKSIIGGDVTMARLWRWIKHIGEGLIFAGLIVTMLGNQITSDPKWFFLAILVAGSFIADEIDDAIDEDKKDKG